MEYKIVYYFQGDEGLCKKTASMYWKIWQKGHSDQYSKIMSEGETYIFNRHIL